MRIWNKSFEEPYWALGVWAVAVVFGGLVVLLATCASAPRIVRVPVPVSGTGAVTNAVVAAVEIDAACPGEVAHHGSGVIIAPNRVVTAYHVAPCGNATILATTFAHRIVPMRVEAALVDADVVRLVSSDPDPFGNVRAVVGPPPAPEDVVCLSVAAPARSYRCGPVMSLESGPSDNLDYRARTEHGNSGSGIYDLRGRLVGVVTAIPMFSDVAGGSDYGSGTSLRGIEWIAWDWYGGRR